MTKFVPVSRERHAEKKWRRPTTYGFAASDALAPAFGAELSGLALMMPVVFVEQAGRGQLMALMSLTPGRNLFVGADGRWLGNYVPLFLRTYPLRLLQREGSDAYILCVDEDSGLVVGGKEAGEDFFDADGALSAATKSALERLSEHGRSGKATQVAVAALFEAGVVQPWRITLKTEQGEQTISGLQRLDEDALNGLGDEAFGNLRRAGALPIAYAQLLSMGQIGVFGDLAKLQALSVQAAKAATPAAKSWDGLLQASSEDLIRFD